MHECASIIVNSFHLFQQTLFNKEFIVEGEEGVLKERVKTDRGQGGGGGGVKPISMLTLWKNAWFSKQQIEFALISCLAVAKIFINKG